MLFQTVLYLLPEAPVTYAYIDPGTGSMLFTVLVGAISVIIYGLRGLIIRLRYSLHRDVKADEGSSPFVIFSDDKRYWTTFRSICDGFEKRKLHIVYMTQSEDDPVFDKQYEYIKPVCIGKGNRGFARLNMLNTDIVLSTTPGLDVYQWKRSRNVKWYTHVYHSANDATRYRMFGIDYYDSIILSGEYQVHQIRELERIRKLPEKELLVLGLPYLDELKKRIDSEGVEEHSGKTVLLAPSWGASSILNRYGEKIIEELLKTGYHLIIRPHPQSFSSEKEMIDRLMKKYPESDQLEWNRDNDNFYALRRADILISDFSGVIFDFALAFDRPVIYADTSYDPEPYDSGWLDEPLWTFTVLPKIGKQLTADNLEGIKDLIDSCTDSSQMKKAREKARKETWANIGKSSESIVEYLVSKREELKQREQR